MVVLLLYAVSTGTHVIDNLLDHLVNKEKPIELEIQFNQNIRITMLTKWRHSEE